MNYTNKIDIRGKAFEEIFTEILFKNKTVELGYVDFADNIKANSIFTSNINTVTMQTYTVGAPSATGSIALSDIIVTPVKVMYYDEFDYEQLRSSRFNQDMQAGAWNTLSAEFDRKVLGAIAPKISYDAESKFWNGASSTTKSTVAGLTAASGITTAEQAYVAAAPTTLFDGVVTYMIYNNSAMGGRISVTGSTITSANIADEYAKAFAVIPGEIFATDRVKLYAPHSHKQLISIYNINQTYRDKFLVTPEGKFSYLGIEIYFVPLPESCIIAALPENIIWCTDLTSDLNQLYVDKIANNRDDYFYKSIFTIYAVVMRQTKNVLYKS